MTRLRLLLPVLLLSAAAPALAQEAAMLDKRVGKLESEMRAVQRKIFPGANQKFFEPEFPATDPAAAAPPAGVPATSPIADLTTRVDALERQLATLTGQVEQAGFKVRQLEEALAKFRSDAEFRLTQLEGGAPPATPTAAPAAPPPGAAAPPAAAAAAPSGAAAPAPAASAAAKPAPSKPPVAAPKPAPGADSAAAEPATAAGDPIEAQYQAAYLAYANKDYSKAADLLAAFVAKNPRSPRASHAQYWLGRTYMAQKQPAQAAKAFLDNYRNMPKGARAPESLYWLGQSLMAMTPPNPAKACEVYDELQAAYGTKLAPPLKDQVVKARAAAKCAA